MVEHVCEKCGRIFNRKDRWRTHINRKYPCVKEKELTEQEKMKNEIDELREQVKKLTLIIEKKNQ